MIWRHDVVKTKPFQKGKYSEFSGGNSGVSFNDWPCLRSSKSAYISSVSVKSSDHIVSIQVRFVSRFTD